MKEIVVISLGSSKISCCVSTAGEGAQKILYCDYIASRGVQSGAITDVNLCADDVLNIIRSAERKTGLIIKRVALLLSPCIAHSTLVDSVAEIQSGAEITRKDADKAVFRALNCVPEKHVVIHSFICSYYIDGVKVAKPFGLLGNELKCQANLVHVNRQVLSNIIRCLAKVGLEVSFSLSEAYATGNAVIPYDQRCLGTNIIDFGCSHTSITIFRNDTMVYSCSVPFGGLRATEDISQCLSIPLSASEKIKNLFGSMGRDDYLHKNEIIELENDHIMITNGDLSNINLSPCDFISRINQTTQKSFPRSIVDDIIYLRIQEIISLLINEVESNNVALASNTVLVGGGARLTSLIDYLANVFQHNVAFPLLPHIEKFNYANYLELLPVYGGAIIVNEIMNQEKEKNHLFFRFFSKIKSFFRGS